MAPLDILLDEAFQERRSSAGSSEPTSVAEVGDVAVWALDGCSVLARNRHVPDGLKGPLACLLQLREKTILIVGEGTGRLVTEGNHAGSRQGGQVNNLLGRVVLLHISERVGKHKSSLGVGVADRNVETLHALDDVAGL